MESLFVVGFDLVVEDEVGFLDEVAEVDEILASALPVCDGFLMG